MESSRIVSGSFVVFFVQQSRILRKIPRWIFLTISTRRIHVGDWNFNLLQFCRNFLQNFFSVTGTLQLFFFFNYFVKFCYIIEYSLDSSKCLTSFEINHVSGRSLYFFLYEINFLHSWSKFWYWLQRSIFNYCETSVSEGGKHCGVSYWMKHFLNTLLFIYILVLNRRIELIFVYKFCSWSNSIYLFTRWRLISWKN